jgi:hypothetical protein
MNTLAMTPVATLPFSEPRATPTFATVGTSTGAPSETEMLAAVQARIAFTFRLPLRTMRTFGSNFLSVLAAIRLGIADLLL